MTIGICGKMCSGKSIVASYLVERGYILIDVDVYGHQALEIHRQQLISVFGQAIVDDKSDTEWIAKKYTISQMYDSNHNQAEIETNDTIPTDLHANDSHLHDIQNNSTHNSNHNSDLAHNNTSHHNASHHNTAHQNTPHTRDRIDRKKLAKLVFGSSQRLQALERIVHPTMISNIRDTVHNHSGSDIVIDAALLYKLNLHRLCDVVFFIDTNLFKRIQRYRARVGGAMWSVWRAMRIFSSQHDISVNNLSGDVDTVVVRNNRSERELRAAVAQYIV